MSRRMMGRAIWAATTIVLLTSLTGCKPGEPVPASSTHRSGDHRELPPLVEESTSELEYGPAPRFTIVGAESGLDFQRFDDISGRRRILETNGGGVALADFDRDGRLDVFLTNGCRLPRRPDDRETPSPLFRSLGQFQFSRVSSEAGLAQFGFACGCAVGDYDADGFDDLYVTELGQNTFWRNNGDGTFTDATESTGTAVPAWSSSAAFADVNGDGILDLYVVNYLDESDSDPRLCPNPNSPDGYEGCSPALFNGVDDVLFLGTGKGNFINATRSVGISGHPGKGLGVVISDLDSSGLPEIYVANDGEANFLFVPRRMIAANEAANSASRHDGLPDLFFDEQALLSGVALNERGYAQASMGIAAGDIDANGTGDLFLTHFFGDTNTLYVNKGGLSFVDRTRGSGLGASSRQTLGFGTLFLDADNDGWLDLFVANGHVDDRTWMHPSQPYAMPPQFYRNERNATFAEVSRRSGPYFHQSWLGRGVASGDLDRDGRIDLVVSHQLAPSVALRNDTAGTFNAVNLRLVGTDSNRNGYGARVEVFGGRPRVVREVCGGQSFQSALAPEVHLGIGTRMSVELRITWPSGTVDVYEEVAPGNWIAIEESSLIKALPIGERSAAPIKTQGTITSKHPGREDGTVH